MRAGDGGVGLRGWLGMGCEDSGACGHDCQVVRCVDLWTNELLSYFFKSDIVLNYFRGLKAGFIIIS